MLKNLVIAGGAIKGISYIGVFKALKELQLLNNIENICGVSAGSIAGLCLFLEMTYTSIEKIVFEIMDYDNIVSNKNIDIINILDSYGIESGENIIKILGIILEKKNQK